MEEIIKIEIKKGDKNYPDSLRQLGENTPDSLIIRGKKSFIKSLLRIYHDKLDTLDLISEFDFSKFDSSAIIADGGEEVPVEEDNIYEEEDHIYKVWLHLGLDDIYMFVHEIFGDTPYYSIEDYFIDRASVMLFVSEEDIDDLKLYDSREFHGCLFIACHYDDHRTVSVGQLENIMIALADCVRVPLCSAYYYDHLIDKMDYARSLGKYVYVNQEEFILMMRQKHQWELEEQQREKKRQEQQQ